MNRRLDHRHPRRARRSCWSWSPSYRCCSPPSSPARSGSPRCGSGIAAVSLTFLSGYGGMVSLAQTALFGVAGLIAAKLSVEAGWNPWAAALAGILAATVVGLLFGAVASGSQGIYFLDHHAGVRAGDLLLLRRGARRSARTRASTAVRAAGAPRRPGAGPDAHVLLPARRLRRSSSSACATSPGRRSGWRCRACATTRCGWPPSATTCGCTAPSASRSPRPSPGPPGCCRRGRTPACRPARSRWPIAILVLTAAVIGGLNRLEGAWVGALLYTLLRHLPARLDRPVHHLARRRVPGHRAASPPAASSACLAASGDVGPPAPARRAAARRPAPAPAPPPVPVSSNRQSTDDATSVLRSAG